MVISYIYASSQVISPYYRSLVILQAAHRLIYLTVLYMVVGMMFSALLQAVKCIINIVILTLLLC
jgi:hypothetical protein